MYEPYLTHHGIKGQKWGVRRFQNEDGSLTEYGKKYNPNQPSEASQPMFDARVKYAAANSRKDRKQATKEFKDAKKLFKQEIKVAQKEERTISKEIGKLKKLKTNDKGQYINKNGEVLSEQVLGAAQNYETLKKIKRESGNKRLNKVQYRRDYISLGDKYVRTVKYKRYNEVKPLTKHDKNLLIAYSRIQKLGFENMHEPYLAHHGIKGQKWGVRRYQNKDGSLTKAGIQKYAMKGYKEDYNKSKNSSIVGRAGRFLIGSTNRNAIANYTTTTNKQHLERAKQYRKEHLVRDRRIVEANKKKREAESSAKLETKNKIKQTRIDIANQMKSKKIIHYSPATRKKAAKFVVKNNMTYNDALKKASGKVRARTTALIAGSATALWALGTAANLGVAYSNLRYY